MTIETMIVIGAIVLGAGPMVTTMILTEKFGWGYPARALTTGAATFIGLAVWLIIFA